PQALPKLPPHTWQGLADKSYQEVAEAVLSLFVEGGLDRSVLKGMIREAYQHFSHPAITPLRQIGDDEWSLELCHGPTLAFMDIALQLLGHIFDHLLAGQGKKVTVLGATSGDTGSAAIAGLRGRKHMQVFILHPHNRVSEVQRRQMTPVPD